MKDTLQYYPSRYVPSALIPRQHTRLPPSLPCFCILLSSFDNTYPKHLFIALH